MQMQSISYLEFLGQPTAENIRFVHDTCGMSQPKAAALANVATDTYKGWLSSGTRARVPTLASWNYFLFQLEAIRIGYADLKDLFEKISSNNACNSVH